MKKFLKIISIILFFICFLFLFLCPCVSSADFSESVYDSITTYRDYVQGTQNSILSQFFTYNYVGLHNVFSDGSTSDYRLNMVVTNVSRFSDSNFSYIRYTVGTGSYYYSSADGFLVPHLLTGNFSVRIKNGVAEAFNFSGGSYYFDLKKEQSFPVRTVTYFDLTDSYYINSHDGTSLQRVELYPFPHFSNGVVSTPSSNSTFGDNLQRAIDTVAPAPVVTTLPPFIPPSTLPPATLPPEIVTIYPPSTDIDGSYIIDYQPYIHGDFFPITTIQDDTIISASGSIISYSWDMLTADEQIKSIILLILVLSLVIGLLT